MKFRKILIYSLLLFIILSTTYLLRESIYPIAAKYLPVKVKAIIKIIINNNDYSKRLDNDYNVKFLPETQFTDLKFYSKNLDFLSPQKIDAYSVSKSFKSFYIDIDKRGLIYLTDIAGNIFSFENLDKIFVYNKSLSPIKSNLKAYKVLDTYIHENNFFISYVLKKDDCTKFVISKSKLDSTELKFEQFFKDDTCAKFIQAGRMQSLKFNNVDGIIFSMADNISDKATDQPQSDKSNFGKIIFKGFESEDSVIYSKGHRNPQGLYVDSDVILSTEHGPKGADEINKIQFDKNYGWPNSSYGKKYFSNEMYLQNHEAHGYEEPIFSFIKAIGISEIFKIPNTFNKYWQDNFIISSLYGHSLFRVKFDKNFEKIIYKEKIYIGQRIRDIKFYNNKLILALETKGELGVLESK